MMYNIENQMCKYTFSCIFLLNQSVHRLVIETELKAEIERLKAKSICTPFGD